MKLTIENKESSEASPIDASCLLRFTVITLFPDLIKSYLNEALIARALKKGLVEIRVVDLRLFSQNKYKSVDDTLYGGGDGMLITPEVLDLALSSILNSVDPVLHDQIKVIYLSPQGRLWNYHLARQWAGQGHQEDCTRLETEKIPHEKSTQKPIDRVLICGRYAGVDQRFIYQCVDEEISIGDFVLSGGELAALTIIESVLRFVPGFLGTDQSAGNDSFEALGCLEAPQFTKPRRWNGHDVPEVLTSGNHKEIIRWKKLLAVLVTLSKRIDLFDSAFVDRNSGQLKNEKFLREVLSFFDMLSLAECNLFQIDPSAVEKLRQRLG